MSDRKPKWSKWNLIDDAKVWQVIALSLDIDPDRITRDGNDWMAGGGYVNHEGDEFKDRLDVIKANYRRIDDTPKTLSMNGIEFCDLNIPKFAKWALSVNWEIPPELAALTSDELESSKMLFDTSKSNYPIELDFAVKAWQAVSATESNVKPKARIKAWLNANASELSDEAKKRICVVANWDKKGGATKTS